MGEQADYLIDQMIDECYEYAISSANMRGPHSSKSPRCKHCGKKTLHWVQLSSGWRLHEQDGKVHECSKHPSKVIKPVYEANELLKRCLKYLPDRHLDDCPKLIQHNNPPCKCRNEQHKVLKNIIKEFLNK